MRWFWIDRFTEFRSGLRASAVKNVTLSDEPLDGYSPAHAVYPSSLIIEGLAQVGGLLVAQLSDFQHRVVLAKISGSRFFRQAVPGDTLTLTAEIDPEKVLDHGASITGSASVNGERIAEVDLMFAYLDERFKGVALFEPAEFCRMLRLIKLFDVAVDRDGEPLAIPQHLADAERASLALV
jgi:3-hydroxyacyl-[acyl-carrier-protein] dehydratase